MRAFQSPNKYIQHKGALSHAGNHIKTMFPNVKKSGIILPKNLTNKYEVALTSSLNKTVIFEFDDECTRDNMTKIKNKFQDEQVDHVIAFGGGKVLDIGKLVAHELSTPSVIIPSLASTDAPCTALSVIYKENGEFEEYKFFSKSPDIIIVDTQVIADAPWRYLVAGMGDALSTYYEAAACMKNPQAKNIIYPFIYRPTYISQGIAKQCLHILFEHGMKAKYSCMNNEVTEPLEKVIEANILMSGLGAESGGLAMAHGLHNALTSFKETHSFLHGEKVAYGVIVQLIAEGNFPEAIKVAVFNKKIGLPYKLKDLGVCCTQENIRILAEKCLEPGNTSWNLGNHLTVPEVVRAINETDHLI